MPIQETQTTPLIWAIDASKLRDAVLLEKLIAACVDISHSTLRNT